MNYFTDVINILNTTKNYNYINMILLFTRIFGESANAVPTSINCAVEILTCGEFIKVREAGVQ